MPRIFLLATLRNLLRHKLQSLINIASLSLGLTVFAFAFLYVKQELSYDRGWIDGERVHRLLVEHRGLPGMADGVDSSVLGRVWPQITEYFASDIEFASRAVGSSVKLADDESVYFTGIQFVDPQFIDIFPMEVVAGDLARTLSGPGFIAVEETTAERLGFSGRVGERFMLKSFNGGQVEYELSAIYRLPQPATSATSTRIFTLIHEYALPFFVMGENLRIVPWEYSSPVWLKLKPGVDTENFNARQPAFIQQAVTTYNDALGAERKISDHMFYRWQPVTEIHFNPIAIESGFGAGGDPIRVATFAAVGLLVLLVGCSNSISLSLAAALDRRREIGVRKAAGALPHDILWQQLGESVLLALLALLPAVAMLELLLPSFRVLLRFSTQMDAGWSEYALLTGIAVSVGIACGAYPALVLSATRPQAVLRAGAQQGIKGSLGLRTVLVAVQFCFASMLLIGTAALYLQLAVTRAQPLGFDASNIAFLYRSIQGVSLDALRLELEKEPGVIRVIPGSNSPNANMPLTMNNRTLVREISTSNEVKAQTQVADFDFVELLGMRVLAGRFYDVRFDIYNREEGQYGGGEGRDIGRMVINASAARQLGFTTPEAAVDQTIYTRFLNNQTGEVTNTPVRIIGVLEDNQYASLRRRPGPEIYTTIPGGSSVLMVKYEDTSEEFIQQRIQDLALRVNGSPLSSIIFAEPQIEAAFQQEQNESKLLLICGGLALLLASIGLYGLATFAIERQVKEIGIRKVMGADVGTIVGLYLWRFARPILIANLVAWPVAIYFVLQWIERFPYQMERVWLVPLCFATLGVVLLISMLTVSVITTRAASANPVRSLRYE